MDHFNRIILSNRTEQLYEELKKALFSDVHPLSKRLVIVPSSAMKGWLMMRMARDPDLGVAAGIEIDILEPAIESLLSELNVDSANTKFYVPTPTELSFAIEEAVMEELGKWEGGGSVWKPLTRYLGSGDRKQNRLTRQGRNRLAQLSTALSKLFRNYGIFGERMIASWHQGNGEWQERLWLKLEQLFTGWGYPVRQIARFSMKRDVSPVNRQIHLFGMSYLAPVFFRLLSKIGKQLPVSLYLLSPCEKFWGDILSEKEGYLLTDFHKKRQMNEREISHLDQLLRDTNPLLANFGRLGREMAALLEGFDAVTEERYQLPSAVAATQQYEELMTGEEGIEADSGGLTLLKAVQADITLLRNPNTGSKILFDGFDSSVQVHAVPKLSREVEVVYDLIMGIIDKHKGFEKPIAPADIFVMAPNIAEYAPFIRAVFESTESRLDIQLMDHHSPSLQSYVQGFMLLLELSRSRWEASSLIALFEHPSFREKHRLSGEDLKTIRKWIEAAGINWGKDEEHRNQIFSRCYEGKIEAGGYFSGTWEHGLGSLLEGMAIDGSRDQESESAYMPLEAVESAKGELLGFVVHLIRSLQADLKVLHDGTEMTLEEWSAYLKCLADAYFSQRDADGDIEGSKTIASIIDAIGKASAKLPKAKYPFESIQRRIEELLNAREGGYKEGNVHSVRFASLQPMRALPARVVVLMGMNDAEFPRIEPATPLDVLKSHPDADYQPAQVDFDRYLFLEAILSARDYFVMTYVSQEAGSPQLKAPSILVGELLDYIDNSYSLKTGNENSPALSSLCRHVHHLQPFHHAYFEEGSFLKSYLPSHYLAAHAYYCKERQLPKPFMTIPPYAIEGERVQREPCTIDLHELTAFAKNPLRAYFKQLGLTIPKNMRFAIDEEEALLLSSLNRAIVLKERLGVLSESSLNISEKKGLIPQGTFSRHAKDTLRNEHEAIVSSLREKGIDPEGLYSLEFRAKYPEPKREGNVWMLPPLTIETPETGKVTIVGRIDGVSNEGVVLYSSHSEGKEFENLPLLLTLGALIERDRLPVKPKLHFCKKDKAKEFGMAKSDSREYLAKYLSYFFRSLSKPSPLAPDFIKPIMNAEGGAIEDHIAEAIDDEFSGTYDHQLKWLGRMCSSRGGLEGDVASWTELIAALNPNRKDGAV